MPVNDKIRTVDYNSIRNKVVNVLGVGSGDAGYGQATQSPTVNTSNRVTVNEYFLLRLDIINAYRHIFGETPPLAEPNINDTIRYNVPGITTTEYTDAEYGIDEFNLETIQGSTTPFPQYELIVDQIVAGRFSVHPSQAITTNKGTQSRGTWNGEFWNNRLSCTVAVTFTTSNQARFFFNSGGEIRFESSRSGGVTSQQNTAWSSLLNAAGMQSFGGNTPGTGVSPLTGQNFYRLTNNYQVWYVNAASSPYTTNQYQISARSNVANNSAGTANTVEFLVEWIDGYTDPGAPLPGDTVDGTITLSLSTLEASGVLVPVGAGNFVVESPAVTIGSIVQDPNGTQFTPQGTITGTLTSGSFVFTQVTLDAATGTFDQYRDYSVTLNLQGSPSGTYAYTVTVSGSEFSDGNNQKFGTVTASTAAGFQVRIRPNQTAQLTATLSRPSFQNRTLTLSIPY